MSRGNQKISGFPSHSLISILLSQSKPPFLFSIFSRQKTELLLKRFNLWTYEADKSKTLNFIHQPRSFQDNSRDSISLPSNRRRSRGLRSAQSMENTDSMFRKPSKKNTKRKTFRNRYEILERRDLLSAGGLTDAEYASILENYSSLLLPESMESINVIEIDLSAGEGINELFQAIEEAEKTESSDLIAVRTSSDAYRLNTYSPGKELAISISESESGSVTLVGLGEKQLILDAAGGGAALMVYGTSLGLANVELTGGLFGLYAEMGGNYRLEDCLISENSAGTGGGIYAEDGTWTLTNCAIIGNSGTNGAGIHADGTEGTWNISNCQIKENKASGSGGGICVEAGIQMRILNTEITRNTAELQGGGLNNMGNSLLYNSTIAGNNASVGGGAANENGNVSFYSSIIAENGNDSSEGRDIWTLNPEASLGQVETSVYYCLVGCITTGTTDEAGEVKQYNSIVGTAAALQNAGFQNSAAGDYSLSSKSAAIDNGIIVLPLNYDLAGVERISGSYADIGAYEYQKNETRTQENFGSTVFVTTSEDIINPYDGKISLREAVSYAKIGGRVAFNLSSNSLKLYGAPIAIDNPLTIQGKSSSNKTTISGSGLSNIFIIDEGTGTVTLQNLIMTEGSAAYGGALEIYAGNQVTITDCVINDSIAEFGGAIFVNGISDPENPVSTQVQLKRTEISGNSTKQHGGGIYSTSTLWTVTDSKLNANRITEIGYGGGIFSSMDEWTFTNSKIYGNSTLLNGGGIFSEESSWKISGAALEDNSAGEGGGIYARGGVYELAQTTINSNKAANGAGINATGTWTITDSNITKNIAESDQGGGVYCAGGDWTFNRCSISENSASSGGAGISNHAALLIRNSLIVKNQVTSEDNPGTEIGGGILNEANATLQNVTIANNSAAIGAGTANIAGVLSFTNSIIADNGTKNTDGRDIWTANQEGTQTFILNSLISRKENETGKAPAIYDSLAGTIANPLSPGFVDGSGGDWHLDADSPAIDAGILVHSDAKDLDGNVRNQGTTIDLGAYEFSQYTPARVKETPQTVVTTEKDISDAYDGLISLREAVAYAAEGDSITFEVDKVELYGAPVSIDKAITINGKALDSQTVIDGKNLSALLTVKENAGSVTLQNLILTRGWAQTGGAIQIYGGNDVSIIDCLLTENTAAADGGAIWFSAPAGNASLSLLRAELTENSAAYGAALFLNGGLAVIQESSLKNNSASSGAGIFSEESEIQIWNSQFDGNTGSTGGAIYASDSILNIANSVFAANRADNGSVIYANSAFSIVSSTVAGNMTANTGEIIYAENGLHLFNSIICANLLPDSPEIEGDDSEEENSGELFQLPLENGIRGQILTNSFNLFGDDPGFISAPILTDDGQLLNRDTINLRLRDDSMAIDAGYAAFLAWQDSEIYLTDADGNDRIINALGVERIDIGAYEYQSAIDSNQEKRSLIVTTLEDLTDPNDGLISLREAIDYADFGSTISFAPGLEGTIFLNAELDIRKQLLIRGERKITLDGQGKNRLISNSASLEIDGLNLTNGFAEYGAAIVNSGTLAVKSSSITQNHAIIDSDSDAAARGGAIFNSGSLKILNSVLTENSASTENPPSNTSSQALGGAIFNTENGELLIINSMLAANKALAPETASQNAARGGGIFNDGGNALLQNSILVENSAQLGNDAAGILDGAQNLSSFQAWDMDQNYLYDPNVPIFKDKEAGDYRVIPNEQTMNRGNDQLAAEAGIDETWTDLAGEKRFHEQIDIGPYESFGVLISQNDVFRGTLDISWLASAETDSVRITWTDSEKESLIAVLENESDFSWDTTAFNDGSGLLKVEYLDENGQSIQTFLFNGTILNNENVVLHRENITDSETWNADKIHVVVGQLKLKNGASITVAQNAILKFAVNSAIFTETGTSFSAENGVTFTRLEDDSVGGDTNGDADSSIPRFGSDYLAGNGVIETETARMKYLATKVEPLPDSTLEASILLKWTGTGEKYRVYVSANGGEFTLAADGISQNQYEFYRNEFGKHEFIVTAVDEYGTEETKTDSDVAILFDFTEKAQLIVTSTPTAMDSHAISAEISSPANEWNTLNVECWSNFSTAKSFEVRCADIFTLDEENIRKQNGVEVTITRGQSENGFAIWNVRVECSEEYSAPYGANTLLASIAFTPQNALSTLPKGTAVTNALTITENETSKTFDVNSVIYDMNDDGLININDLVQFARLFNTSTLSSETSSFNENAWTADFNSDSRVDITDLVLFARNFGKNTTPEQITYAPGYQPQTDLNPQTSVMEPAAEVIWETPIQISENETTEVKEPIPCVSPAMLTDLAWENLMEEEEEEEEEEKIRQRNLALSFEF